MIKSSSSRFGFFCMSFVFLDDLDTRYRARFILQRLFSACYSLFGESVFISFWIALHAIPFLCHYIFSEDQCRGDCILRSAGVRAIAWESAFVMMILFLSGFRNRGEGEPRGDLGEEFGCHTYCKSSVLGCFPKDLS